MSADPDPEALRTIYKFVANEIKSDDICRLCLKPSNEKVSFDETLVIEKPYFNETLTFLDIFDEINFCLEEKLPHVFCNDCASIVINHFLFKKLFQYSTEHWGLALKNLEDCINDHETIGNNKAVIFDIDNANTYFTPEPLYSISNACITLNSAIKNENDYNDLIEQLIEDVDESEIIKSKARNGSYPCKKCTKVFSTLKQLRGHMERMHKTKNVECTKCEKRFPSVGVMKAHIHVHHKPVTCNLCALPFPCRYELNRHLAKHDMLTCPDCNKSYNNKNYFKIHRKTCSVSRNAQTAETYVCDICDKGYIRKNSLRSHLKVEHGFGKLYTCKWCHKKFDAISRLNSHVVKHTKEKNFSCEICGGIFVTSAALVYHKRLHTGEKPFPCDLCDESFLSASRRMEHKHRKHFGPQQACPKCPMKFITKCQLNKHVERHSNPASKIFIRELQEPEELEEAVEQRYALLELEDDACIESA